MTHRGRRRLLLLIVMVIVSIGASPLFGILFVPNEQEFWIWIRLGAFLIGAVITWGVFMLFFPSRYGESIRRLSFPARLATYCGFVVIVVLVAPFMSLLIQTGQIEPLIAIRGGTEIFPFVGVLVFVLLPGVQISRIIGPRVLGNILIGHYHAPVREERAFLFVDLVGSTELAKQLGDLVAQRMLARFFFDISEPVLENRGEIHAYIGDGVIITWPLAAAVHDARCVQCFFAIEDEIARRADAYQSRFGFVPRVRAGLHGGSVVVSECGDAKRAIVYFGDTMNTASRIEGEAKRLDRALVATSSLIERMMLPPGIVAEDLDDVVLRGHSAATQLVSLSRRLGSDEFSSC